MIFVAVGTHPGQFTRLIKHLDEIAPQVKDKIVIQRGFTKYVPKNCESFDFTEDIDSYYKRANLVIVQSATSLLEFSLKYKKPVITVPRRAKFKEHIDNHQVEFGEYFSKKTGIPCIINISDLTPESLNNYRKIPKIEKSGIIKLQSYFKDLFEKMNGNEKEIRPYASNRFDYMFRLLNPTNKDKILNVGISNIPDMEMILEEQVKECWTIDFDKNKLNKAKPYLKKTRLVQGDITKYSGFKKNYFDKIIILEVLEHLKNDDAAVKWMKSILKKGGKIVASVPNDALIHYINPVKYAEHERHYSIKMIRELFERNGFKIEHINLVERWTLLFNVYMHIFFKFILRKQVKFGVLKRLADKSYRKRNKKGLDIVISAIKN